MFVAFLYLLIPLLLVALPSILVLKQPDLGTALFLVLIGVTVLSLGFGSGSLCWPLQLLGRDTHRLEHAAYLSAKAHSNLLQP